MSWRVHLICRGARQRGRPIRKQQAQNGRAVTAIQMLVAGLRRGDEAGHDSQHPQAGAAIEAADATPRRAHSPIGPGVTARIVLLEPAIRSTWTRIRRHFRSTSGPVTSASDTALTSPLPSRYSVDGIVDVAACAFAAADAGTPYRPRRYRRACVAPLATQPDETTTSFAIDLPRSAACRNDGTLSKFR